MLNQERDHLVAGFIGRMATEIAPEIIRVMLAGCHRISGAEPLPACVLVVKHGVHGVLVRAVMVMVQLVCEAFISAVQTAMSRYSRCGWVSFVS